MLKSETHLSARSGGPKRAIGDLALFGGSPEFDGLVMVGRPNLGDRSAFLGRIHGLLDRERLSNNGPLVQEFEGRIAAAAGVKHCVATSSATSGLELALRATGRTGEVIVPSLTFVATAHAVRWVGSEPVFCDVEPDTGAIDPVHAESLITPRTVGIIGVHLWGRPCAAPRLEAVAAEHGVRLIFDAAHAFGCSLGGRRIGGFGDAEVFSFHATKVVNAFEGGAVVTDDDALAADLRLLRNFGMDEDKCVVSPGTNAKMSEVAAAMGLTSLEAFDYARERNAENYRAYRSQLTGLRHVRLIDFDPAEQHNFSYVVAQIDESCGIDRDLILRLLRMENVMAQPYFSPAVHTMPPYRGTPAYLPEADRLAARSLALPTGPATSPQAAAAVGALVRFAVENGPAIARRLRRS